MILSTEHARLPRLSWRGWSRTWRRRSFSLGFQCFFWLLTLASGAAATPDTNRFAFSGPEIFPIDPMISFLRMGDMDGDGLQDLVVVNNARSKINVLLNQTGKTNLAVRPSLRRDINELPPDARFRIESIASEKRISSLLVTDLNGDRRHDLAFFGEPKELVVLYSQGTNTWSTPKRWPMEDGVLNPNSLAEGDLNGDKRQDLVLLGENAVYFFAQKEDHTLAEPEKIPYTGSVKALQILDIDGDERQDLLLVNWDSTNPFRFRIQNSAGQLGPEIHFPMPVIRSYLAEDLDGDRRTEVVAIAQKSGRAQLSHFVQKEPEALSGEFRRGQFQVLPLNKTTKSKRGMRWVDINQDQREDLVVAEPDSGQLTIYLQQADGSMAPPKTYSTFTGVTEVCAADWDGDGRMELFLLSSDERQVGVTQWAENGRLAFPTILPFEGRPLAIATGRLRSGGPPVLAVLVDQDGKRDLVWRSADGETRRQRLSESFKSNPASMAFHDLNQDGLEDLVILIQYEKMKTLVQLTEQEKMFEEQDIAPPGGSSEQPWLSAADVDGDNKEELLLAQKNFVRAVVMQTESLAKGATNKPSWTFKVKEQVNGSTSASRVVGAAALRNGTNQIASLFLLDAEKKALTLCERDGTGVWQAVRSVLLPVSDFSGLQSIRIGGGQPNAVAFLGLNAVAWMRFSGNTWESEELDDYESPIKDAFLHDVVAGDLNNDRQRDLVFLETGRNYLDIVTYEPPHKLVPANRWQVFEERTFRNRRSDLAEPREALVGDLTGDGRSDLAIIVHDRILVYPQE